jgi:hypothetical protein
MKPLARKSQSFLEYSMLVIIVAAALLAMNTYVMRAMNARLKQAQEELSYHRAD